MLNRYTKIYDTFKCVLNVFRVFQLYQSTNSQMLKRDFPFSVFAFQSVIRNPRYNIRCRFLKSTALSVKALSYYGIDIGIDNHHH